MCIFCCSATDRGVNNTGNFCTAHTDAGTCSLVNIPWVGNQSRKQHPSNMPMKQKLSNRAVDHIRCTYGCHIMGSVTVPVTAGWLCNRIWNMVIVRDQNTSISLLLFLISVMDLSDNPFRTYYSYPFRTAAYGLRLFLLNLHTVT